MNRFLVLIFAILIVSCFSDDVNKAYYTYQFFENSDLTISSIQNSYMKYGTVSEGDKTVFKYTYVAEDEEEIADDEYAEFIYFEVDSGLESFLLEEDELSNANVTLTKSCFCFFSDSPEKNVVPFGFISGEKISNDTWQITLEVTFYGDEHRSFEEIFVLDEI